MAELVANVCAECGADLNGKIAWVRSGRLLCSDCDFAHKAPSRQRARVRRTTDRTPQRARGTYYKPQFYNATLCAWVDIQRACATEDEALAWASDQAPKWATTVRAMRVDERGRAPMPERPR